EIQFKRDFDSINNHSSGDIRKVEFLAVVRTKQMVRFVEMCFQKCFEILQNLHFLAVETGHAEIANVALYRKKSYGNADDFSKFRPNAGAFVKIFGRNIILSLVLAFKFPKGFGGIVLFVQRYELRNWFYIQKQDISQI